MNKRVLYIEDDKAQIALIEYYMEKISFPYLLDFAQSGYEGISQYCPKKHQLVVVDYNLPDIQAPQIAETILKKNAICPIIFVSSAFTHEQLVFGKALGAKLCLGKDDVESNIQRIFSYLQ